MAACGAKTEKDEKKPQPVFGDSKTWVAQGSLIRGIIAEMEEKEEGVLKKMAAVKTRFNWTIDKATITINSESSTSVSTPETLRPTSTWPRSSTESSTTITA